MVVLFYLMEFRLGIEEEEAEKKRSGGGEEAHGWMPGLLIHGHRLF